MKQTQVIQLPVESKRSVTCDRSVDRQAHLVAALILTTALLLSVFVSHGWIYLTALPIFGLSLDALTGVCPMTLMLKKMPWNR